MASKIILVEDDATIASGLIYAFEKEGYLAQHCKDMKSALTAINKEHFDLAILDMQLPDGLGKEIGARLKNTDTAIIYLTIVDDENEIVHSFEEGAADYITKPFRLRELLARVKRTLHTEDGKDHAEIVTIGSAMINTTTGQVFVNGEVVELTALEYRLLLIFASNKSILLTREQILEKIWDSSGNFVEDNTLTVYIKRLREKMGDSVNIITVRGMGYRAD